MGASLHQLLPPIKSIPMQPRDSQCLYELPVCHYNLYKRSFVLRNLFLSAYWLFIDLLCCVYCFIVLLTHCSFFSIIFDGVCPSLIKLIVIVRYRCHRYSYYGSRIGTSMRSIKWCHFQWPWTNPDYVFKVTPLFDAKYLRNSYIYGHSYYRRRIANRTQAFEWHQFQWPWVISNPDFKVTILFNVK